jgi:signal transduction histidine kinase
MSLSEILANPRCRLSAEERVTVAAGCFAAMRNMQDLLDNLLRWAFLQMDVETPNRPAEIRQTIHDALALSFAAAEAKGVELTIYAPPLEVETDAEAIGTVVRNLVNNAIKFTKAGGTVRVVADTDGDGLLVAVADSGVGMSAEALETLFPAHFPEIGFGTGDLPRSTPGTDGEPGTGLGLILCRELVERCGGWIGAESVEGTGTTFRFSIPVV